MNLAEDYKSGIEIVDKDTVILYHITKSTNVSSILEKGLIPNRGRNRKRCKYKNERNSKDVWISFCKKYEIESWRKALWNSGKIETSVLEVIVPKNGIKCRHWGEGYEFGYFNGRIEPKNIRIYE